jgi:hypothetical protein
MRRLIWLSLATALVTMGALAVADIPITAQANYQVHAPLLLMGNPTGWTAGATRVTGDADGNSWGASVDGEGRYIVFVSDATNLVAGDSNRVSDIYGWERSGERFERLSVGLNGVEANGASHSARISPDGRYVVFVSGASNLVAGDTNMNEDVFRYDRQTGVTELVSVGMDGSSANGLSGTPDLSGDGQLIVFTSTANNITDTPYPDDCRPGPCRTIYLRDMATGVSETVITNWFGMAVVPLEAPQLSNDGKMMVYGWIREVRYNGSGDIFETSVYRYNRVTGESTLIASPNQFFQTYCRAPVCGHTWLTPPVLAGDGRALAYHRHYLHSSSYDIMEYHGIYLNNVPYYGGGYEVSSAGASGCFPDTEVETITDFAFSYDGLVTVQSVEDLDRMAPQEPPCHRHARPHIPDDQNDVKDVYLFVGMPTTQFPEGRLVRISSNEAGAPGNGASYEVAISDDGYTVAYTTAATDVAGKDGNGAIIDIVVWSWR